MRKHREAYDKFCLELIGSSEKSALRKSLYTVIGAVGSGKSVFVYKLLSERKDTIHCFEENFETKSSNVTDFISVIYSVSEELDGLVTPDNAFILLLMRNIGWCFCSPNYSQKYAWRYNVIPRAEEFKDRILNLCSIYTEYFKGYNDTSWCVGFFEHLNKISEHNCVTSDDISNYIKDYIHGNVIHETYTDDKGKKVRISTRLLDILFRLYFCLSKTDEKPYKGKKLVLFIDNIESALTRDGQDKKGISKSDIKNFLLATHESAKKISDLITDIRDYSPKEKNTAAVILALRDCTFGILEKMRTYEMINLHANNYMSSVEIAEWFDNEEILTNRIKFFTGYEYNSLNDFVSDERFEKSHGVLAYINIIKDRSKSIWGLSDFVNRFYNCSKRFIHRRFIAKFLSSYEKYRGLNGKNELEFFNTQWDKLNAMSRTAEGYMAFKHLCRKIYDTSSYGLCNCENKSPVSAKL